MWKEPSKEELEAAAAQMDDMAPFRNTVGFLGLLLLGKALPDAVFAVLRNWAGIRGAEKLDYAMLGADALFSAVGVGLLYTAIVLMAPSIPELPKSADPVEPR